MHEMQVANIRNYLVDDRVFNITSKLFLTLDNDEVRKMNCHLDKALPELIKLMRAQDSLFDKTFNRIGWAGSSYKKTKIEAPDEYDLNFVIKLPIKEKDIELSTDERYPGYVKIRTTIGRASQCNNLNMGETEYRKMMSFIDDQSLNQDKFRRWIEGVLNKVANATSGSNKIIIWDYTIIIRKSGPAFTLLLHIPDEKIISIDLVPVLAFSYSYLPSRYKNCNLQPSDRCWFAVPKPLKNRYSLGDEYYYWRLSFYYDEKDMLTKYGRSKPVIRQLKKLKSTQGWKSIASYYMETLCLHNILIFENSGKIPSYTFLLFTMLQKLLEAFRQKCIKHYLDKNLNLLEHIGELEMKNMEGRLSSIIKDIERNIANDRFVIAKYILNDRELDILRNSFESVTDLSEIEPEPEPTNQWNCVIL